MKKSAKGRVFDRIKRKGRNWAFSAVDFTRDFKRWEIDQSFVALEKEGKIRRVLPGLYYFPDYSTMLKKFISPSVQEVAYALARKYNWTIFPEGNTALNHLRLSLQVPAGYVYISSGSSRKYKISNTQLEFCHRALKESTITSENANLVVQAIKSMGKGHADKDFLKQLSLRFSKAEWNKIEKDAHKVPGWVLDAIKKAKEFANG